MARLLVLFFLVLVHLCLLLPSAHAQCPAVCACFGLDDTVDCTPRPNIDFRFTVIPPDAPLNTRTLIMTGNALSTLLSGNFSVYTNLETLILDDNLLEEIPPDGLDSLPQLISLSLDGNPLLRLGVGVFRNLSSLQELSIQRTPLTTINATAFTGLNSLKRLIIDDNEISELPADFFSYIPQLEFMSVRRNNLETLPPGFLDPLNASIAQVNITENPWSCDCFLQWLGEFLASNPSILVSDAQTVCLWPPLYINQPISSVPLDGFNCYPLSVVQDPQDSDILTSRTFTLVCAIDGAPFPQVTWTKDGEVLVYTDRVYLDQFNASLQFADVILEDMGVYQCLASNTNSSVESANATLTVTEHTCFDGQLSSHETDIDCGGEFCQPCNITQHCLADRDCLGELVCLFAHQLPSALLYISSSDPIAYTCAEPGVPPILLESGIQASLPVDIFSVNFTGSANSTEVEGAVRELMATQLQVPVSTISNVQVTTVNRVSQPLYQVWFDLQKSQSGEDGRANLLRLIDDGSLKATIRITEQSSSYRVRMNL